jgi:predicted NBD/HSP70 family sugar kinase
MERDLGKDHDARVSSAAPAGYIVNFTPLNLGSRMRDRKRGTVRDLRRENRAAVVWSLYLSQPRSRLELGAATGLSAASVTNVIRELIDEGVVIETGLAESDGGRPRAMLGMNPRYGYVIGVDIGETRTRVELFDLTMTERAKAEYPLDRAAEHDVAVVVGQIASGLDTVLAESGIDREDILGVGIGVPGLIEQGPEVLVHGQTYGWDAVPLGKLLRAHTDLPLRFDNGAKTMGRAELWFGAGRGARNAVMVLIGSGVGASLISGGATYQGATSSAAEFGHVTVAVGGRKCRCGAAGCLEAYAGAEAILERYGRPMAADDQELALAELIDAADTSSHAAGVLDETAEYLGAGIGTLINLFNPERVIVGGWAGLLLGPRLLPEIRESARRHSLRHLFAATSIDLGQLGPDAVARGAATLPMESFLNGSAGGGRAGR